MASSPTQVSKRSRAIDSRAIARKVLSRILEPLAGFVLDSGLSIYEVAEILREAAVKSVAGQQRELNGRLNISGIAASTGISRAEISKILNSRSRSSRLETGHRQQSTYKVLTAWHQNPKFTDSNGQPSDLRLYGRGATFECLVKKFGGGIPPRAMLDELTRNGAIEVKSTQLVRLKSLVAIERGVTPQVLNAYGDRVTELLSTLLQNMRKPHAAVFVANVSGTRISNGAIPLIRQELSARGANFLAEIGDLLVREPVSRKRSKASRSTNVSVTVFLNESMDHPVPIRLTSSKRKNFRRVSSP